MQQEMKQHQSKSYIVFSLEATKVSSIAYLYFAPRQHMEQMDVFEAFLESLSIQSNSPSPSIMERWVNKISNLEQKKKHYEEILRRELSGLDDEFESLRFLSQELTVRARNLRFRKAA